MCSVPSTVVAVMSTGGRVDGSSVAGMWHDVDARIAVPTGRTSAPLGTRIVTPANTERQRISISSAWLSTWRKSSVVRPNIAITDVEDGMRQRPTRLLPPSTDTMARVSSSASSSVGVTSTVSFSDTSVISAGEAQS